MGGGGDDDRLQQEIDNWVLVFYLFFKQIFSSKVPLDSSSFTVPLTPFENWKKVTHSIWQNSYFSPSMDSHLAASGLHFRASSHICQWSLNAFIQPNFMECLTNHWCTNSKDWPTLRNNSVLNSRISSFLRQPCWEKRHTSMVHCINRGSAEGRGGGNPLPLFCKQRPGTSLRAQKWRQRRP